MTSELGLMQGMSTEQRQIFESQMLARRKNPSTATLLSVFGFGRFYLGQPGSGVAQWVLVPFLIGPIWMFIDIFTAPRRTQEYNVQLASVIAGSVISSFPSSVQTVGVGCCHGCGTALVSEAQFCTQCGVPVPRGALVTPSAEAATKKCPVCAETIQKEAKKCRYCNEFLPQETGGV